MERVIVQEEEWSQSENKRMRRREGRGGRVERGVEEYWEESSQEGEMEFINK